MNPLAKISSSHAFKISRYPIEKEKYPLGTALKRKEKSGQARENLSGPFPPATPTLKSGALTRTNKEDKPR